MPRGTRIPALSADAAQLLLTYSWPGNIRELDNLLQRALVLASGPVIDARADPFRVHGQRPGAALHGASAAADTLPMPAGEGELRGSLRNTERDLILNALRAGDSRREVAERLGISPRTLRYKLAHLRATGVEVPAA